VSARPSSGASARGRSAAAAAEPSGPGKLDPAAFERLIAPHLGAARAEVLVGPRAGVDSGIVRIGAGRVMAITADPLSLIPAFGAADSARLSCHLIASDLWTSGIPPAYAAVTLNLPPRMADDELTAYVEAMGDEWRALGVAVVAGHTGRYSGCDLTIVGACTLIGVGDEGRTVGPGHIKPGDRVIVTKDCAVEATAVASRLFPERLAERLGAPAETLAGAGFARVSVVADCRAALAAGVRDQGVSAMHDATEGGVLGGLIELARAGGCDLRVERARIPLSAEARAACELFEIDPYWTLSEGTLIVTARAERAAAVVEALAGEGIPAAEVGDVVRGGGVVWLTAADGAVEKLAAPRPDPYWAAYDRAVREGWK
jgi:hydrogenase expression/formation protein HypE